MSYNVDTFDSVNAALSTASSSISVNSQKIVNLLDPTSPQDATTKTYVDSLVSSAGDLKASVRIATTANITLSGLQTIDGVLTIATDRVLVKNQTAGSENGIYTAAVGAWSRSTDADTSGEVTAETFTFVEEGTVNANTGWVLATNNPIVLNTTSLSFTQFTLTLTASAPANVTKAAAAVGTSATAARSDHKHDISTAVVVAVGTANAEGTATSLARSDHVHNTPFSAVNAAIAAANASISVNSQKITNLLDPTAAQDAVTKAYADALANGLDPKASCRLATTANLSVTASGTGVGKTLTAMGNGAISIDGVSGALTNRILVKNQSTGADNGIYTVTDAGSGGTPYVLTRSTDADVDAEVTAGMFMWVAEGTANADQGWLLTTNDPIVVDTTSLVFTQFSGLGQITAGAGLTKTGNTLDVVAADASITVNADSIEASGNFVAKNISTSGTLSVASLSTSTSKAIHSAGERHFVTVPGDTNYTILVSDYLIAMGTLTAARTLTMPASPTAGDEYKVKDTVGGAASNNIIIAGNGKNIDGATPYTISTNYASVTLSYTGTQWSII